LADEAVKMWVIVIFMFMPLDAENDALTVTHLHGKPLEFSDATYCREHVRKNLDELKLLAREHYSNSPVKQIDCFRKPTEI
tara:strand:+ start:358 stop:600 length:243 start_codon:yes stop_codon:yes gene_type:complete